MKKGAIDYAIILTIITIICLVTLWLQVGEKFQAVQRNIGDSQTSLLRINSERQVISSFITSAARYSMDKTIIQLRNDCQLLNSKSDPGTLVKPNMLGMITKEFNTHMDNYIRAYNAKRKMTLPLSNYELYFEREKVVGAALYPLVVPLEDVVGRPLGSYSFKTGFNLAYGHGFEEFPNVFDTLSTIAADCNDKDDPEDCINQYATDEWEVEKAQSGVYDITLPQGVAFMCYRLALPGISQPTT